MFKFVDADPGTFTQKRKQAQRACESCRKRKKRCHHLSATRTLSHGSGSGSGTQLRASIQQHSPSAQVTGSPTPDNDANEVNESTIGSTQLNGQITRNIPGHEALDSRFIGDLSPEAIFQAATSPDTTRGASLEDSIGVWLAKRLGNGVQAVGSSAFDSQSPSSIFYGSASLVQKILVPVLMEEIVSTLPPPAKVDALSKIYFERIHHIFPVIDENGFHELHPTDPGRILLQQGICLAASKNHIAKEHLVLLESDLPSSYREFGNRLFASMRLSIDLGLVTNKIVLIQALALMSHFADGPDSGDLSSQLSGRAVHHVHSIGLHVRCRHRNPDDQYGITLLCCIWALDRMNAAFHGRPVLMHERDIRTSLDQYFEHQQPCFRLLLHVILLLDKVIELYRPSSSADELELEIEFPSFEELVTRCASTQIATPLLGM